MNQPASKLRRVARAIAWAALVLSFPVWGAAFFAPLLPYSVEGRALFAAACIAAGELLFWCAGLYLGAGVIARFRTPKVDTGSSFQGRHVVVIGASGGLGEAVARAVHREGGALTLIGRDEGRVQALARTLVQSHGPPVEVLVSDLSAAALRQAAARVEAADAVVCATGIDVRKPFMAHDDEDIARSVAVDLTGPIHVAQAFLPRLRERGVIALFGGFADGGVALPYYTVDVATRAGLAGFCAALNRELALEGQSQRLCYVCPAPAETESERGYLELWRSLGIKVVAPAAVADFVLGALLARKTVAVMGFSTRVLARIQGAAPWLGQLLVARMLGRALHARFSAGAVESSSRSVRVRP